MTLCVCVRVRAVFRLLVGLSLVSGGVYWFCGDRVSEGLKMALVLIVEDMPWLGDERFFFGCGNVGGNVLPYHFLFFFLFGVVGGGLW